MNAVATPSVVCAADQRRIRYRYVQDLPEDPPRRVRVAIHNGFEGYWSTFTMTCSGCFSSVDGHPCGDYPTHPKHHCYVGSGCDECGYHGVRRERWFSPFDEAAYEAWIDEQWKAKNRGEA